ncbi:Glucose/ribitol dehydrogenase [Penicillium brevicompactum]|uniref:Glucose/ribitol dehydrogenase n=1 Tax=Penicillium brevicompactum TaxID=5074 RepID=UPI00253F889C|nr:Glucose/ribitol dehydrogenase [Penicillium brevicompactum]KAJ5336389.1 Glucose/ribitol dehydrogenase [Penicillium brevicompactum]
MSDQILSGKTCLITGGGGGLGKAIATQFLEAGANVVICDVNEERLQATSAELSPKGPLKAIKTDITNTSEVERLFETLIGEFGKIDVLVNNAGIMDHFDPIGDLDMELWDRVMAINLTAPALLSKLAVRNMLAQPQPDGRIINIVSVAGKAGWASGAAYTASKHGLVGLTKNTAAYYGNMGIKCNALMMGGMETNIVDAFGSGINVQGMQKLKTVLEAIQAPHVDVNEVAAFCVNLTYGRGASQINGATIAIDNGWTSVVG